MKDFLKRINWKKFSLYSIICFGFLLLLYISSDNVYPNNFYALPVITGLFMITLLVNAYSTYLTRKNTHNNEHI